MMGEFSAYTLMALLPSWSASQREKMVSSGFAWLYKEQIPHLSALICGS